MSFSHGQQWVVLIIMQGICQFEGNVNQFCPCYKCSCSSLSSVKSAVVEKRCLMAILSIRHIPRYIIRTAEENMAGLLDSKGIGCLTEVLPSCPGSYYRVLSGWECQVNGIPLVPLDNLLTTLEFVNNVLPVSLKNKNIRISFIIVLMAYF